MVVLTIGVLSCRNIARIQKSELENENNDPPLAPPKSTDYVLLEMEVDSLEENRSTKINSLMDKLCDYCIVGLKDSMIIQFSIDPNGTLLDFKIMESNINSANIDKTSRKCIEVILQNNDLNLGEIKVIPNARNGSRPQTILYTFPLRKER